MKQKIVLLMMAIAALFFQSCEKESGNVDSDSLAGTKWTVTHFGNKYVMEFTTNKKVQMYEADENYNYENNLKEDKYTRNGNRLVFTDGTMSFSQYMSMSLDYFYHAKSAEIDGSKMVVTTTGKKMQVNLKTGDITLEDVSGKKFTLMKVEQ